ncbi:MAG: glycosyltransferase [Lachnospiraceae bacterium]|nr:glycosyltransferase [Lachnospiraceae bacterium]
MNNQPLISVIIPVYNLENYIERCLISVLSQTYKNLEILVVDDGSTDNSPSLCDKYSTIDSRITVFHIENGGAAHARNVALNKTNGELLTFIDGDDFVDSTYIETLYNAMVDKNADISICKWVDIYEHAEPKALQQSYIKTYDTLSGLEALMYQVEFDSAMWVKLYKSSLFDGIFFPEGNLYEDLAIIYKIFERAKIISYTDYAGYFYTIRNSGTTLIKFKPKKMDLIDVIDEMQDYLLKRYPELRLPIYSRKVRANFHIYLQIPRNKDYKPYRKRIENNIKAIRKDVLLDKKARRGTRLALLLTYAGFNTFYRLKNLKHLGKK